MKVFQHVQDIGDLGKALAEAQEVKRDRYQWQHLGRNKTALLIFFNNSLRTRLSTQKAAMNLGMNVIVLDVNQGAWKLETERGVIMDGDKSEHLLEAIPVMASYCDLIGVRSFARFESRADDYDEKILNQFIRYSGRPVFFMESATVHPLQAFADLITIAENWPPVVPRGGEEWPLSNSPRGGEDSLSSDKGTKTTSGNEALPHTGGAGRGAYIKAHVLDLLKRTIRPEFLNRIDETIMFEPLTQTEIREVVKLQVASVQKMLAQNGITLNLTDAAIDLLTREGYDPEFGARPVKRAIQRLLLNDLSKAVLAGTVSRDHDIRVDAADDRLVFS